jgi:nucleoside-diphosphate-sugar epimerase
LSTSEKSSTILVSGAGGFLGENLINRLSCLTNYKIIALSSQKYKLNHMFHGNINFVCFDTEDWKNGKISFDTVDVLINCAFARTSEGKELANSLDFTNKFILDAVRKGVGGVVNISSQSVYSQQRKFPATEKSSIIPESLYGMAKYSIEILISNICTSANVPFTNIRLASLVGIGFNLRLTTKFIRNVINGDAIKIIGGQQVISYMDVMDAADGITALLSIDTENWKQTYNLGVEEFYTILEIANMIKEIATQYISLPVKVELEDKDVYLNSSMDCTQFYEDVHWKPKYNMESIIKKQFECFKLE